MPAKVVAGAAGVTPGIGGGGRRATCLRQRRKRERAVAFLLVLRCERERRKQGLRELCAGKGRLRRDADAGTRRKGDCLLREDFVHDVSDRTHTTPAGGAAPQAPVNLAGRADGAFGCNRPDLMVRNDITRTHNHDRTPVPTSCSRGSDFAPHPGNFLRRLLANLLRLACHFAVPHGKHNEMKSL
jgi:hypothetical protein